MPEWIAAPSLSWNLSEHQSNVANSITEFMRERLRQSSTDSGLYSFYRSKLEADKLLSESDLGTLAFLAAQRGRWRRIWEIGAGIGQLGAMLAIDGFDVVSIEQDTQRFSSLQVVHDHVVAKGIAGRWQLRHGLFPKACTEDDIGEDLVLALGCAFKAEEGVYRAFASRLANFDAGIIDFGTLFTVVDHEGEEVGRAQAFCNELSATIQPLFRHKLLRRGTALVTYFVQFDNSARTRPPFNFDEGRR